MKEVLTTQTSENDSTYFTNNYRENIFNNISNGTKSQRKYAVLSTVWISAIGEELGLQSLSPTLLEKLAEDVSYRLREILHKCVTRLRHSKRRCLTFSDVNVVITNLCDIDPLLGASIKFPEYILESNLFIPHECFKDLPNETSKPSSFLQVNIPFIQEVEIVNSKQFEIRNNYTKKAFKILFNGSQKLFQVLLDECGTNPYLSGEGLVDNLMSIARSMVISNNAQYTRVLTRTCQLVISISNNNRAIYPYHLKSIDKLSELFLELLLGQGFINPNLETLFKECALKLMLRWPSVADRFIPMLKNVLLRKGDQNFEVKKKAVALELLAGIQPPIFLERNIDSPLSLFNVLVYVSQGSSLWYKIALSVSAFIKSGKQSLSYSMITDHFGDSIIPYLTNKKVTTETTGKSKIPIIVSSKIKYATLRHPINRRFSDRLKVFSHSNLQRVKQEIRFSFAGSKPVLVDHDGKARSRTSNQILRSEIQSSYAFIASRRLLLLNYKRKKYFGISYDLAKFTF